MKLAPLSCTLLLASATCAAPAPLPRAVRPREAAAWPVGTWVGHFVYRQSTHVRVTFLRDGTYRETTGPHRYLGRWWRQAPGVVAVEAGTEAQPSAYVLRYCKGGPGGLSCAWANDLRRAGP